MEVVVGSKAWGACCVGCLLCLPWEACCLSCMDVWAGQL